MMRKLTLEQRVAKLEEEVAWLNEKFGISPVKPWWEQITGSFANEPLFKEAMQLGRAYREAQRPRKPRRGKRRKASS